VASGSLRLTSSAATPMQARRIALARLADNRGGWQLGQLLPPRRL